MRERIKNVFCILSSGLFFLIKNKKIIEACLLYFSKSGYLEMKVLLSNYHDIYHAS